ncbi:MAG: YcgN family cysteine cluster protein [Pseudomonadota bacterium]
MSTDEIPFWKRKNLAEMDADEWESLCDGCARCCMVKLVDEDSGELFFTRAACHLLDTRTCRCTDYDNRDKKVPDCIHVTHDMGKKFDWLPNTCAYRRLNTEQPLGDWHPLISGDQNSVHSAGVSMRGRCISEEHIHPDLLPELIIKLFDPEF